LQLAAVDLNEVATKLERMLSRLLGEDIVLETQTAPQPAIVTADRGQLEQVIVNLAVNGRDAMPTGGRLTIAVAQATLDESFCRGHRGSVPGDYRVVRISDTGCGMSDDTQRHIFEPFYTTKAPGKGTGLGLAVVYGIIKQSNGYIAIDSQLGLGTTFAIYLPAAANSNGTTPSAHDSPVTARGAETVLLVEDDNAVRTVSRRMLESTGYRVLEARSGAEALGLLAHHSTPVDVVVTDVVMPEMSGRELVERLVATGVHCRVLFVSGYTEDTIIRHGELPAGTGFLEKPYTTATLAARVRQLLDSRP
jgi:CheY-like chemotaxis protein